MGDPIISNLLEMIVEITDDAKCKASYSGRITDRMIGTETPSGGKGPCNVRDS
jgi:hypothetical protein